MCIFHFFLFSCIEFCCTKWMKQNESQFHYLFISRRLFRLFPLPSYYQYCGNEHGWANISRVAIKSFENTHGGYSEVIWSYLFIFIFNYLLIYDFFNVYILENGFMSFQFHQQWMQLHFTSHPQQCVLSIISLIYHSDWCKMNFQRGFHLYFSNC